MADYIRCTRATVRLEREDGGVDEFRFFLADDESFDVVVARESGWRKAELGPTTFVFPRWPSSSWHRPGGTKMDPVGGPVADRLRAMGGRRVIPHDVFAEVWTGPTTWQFPAEEVDGD